MAIHRRFLEQLLSRILSTAAWLLKMSKNKSIDWIRKAKIVAHSTLGA
jgi:DNA-directed RNA polymerase specialized sigma24 family protein